METDSCGCQVSFKNLDSQMIFLFWEIKICKLLILPIVRNKHGMGTRDIGMFKVEDPGRPASKVRSVSSAKYTGAAQVKLRDNELELTQQPFVD